MDKKTKLKMMENTIKIKCPYCSSTLSVKNIPGIESKSVTCPICKQKTPFLNYKRVLDRDDDATQYSNDNEKTEYRDFTESPTEINNSFNLTLGRLRQLPSGPSFLLRTGKNVIGRKATQSVADFQIPTNDSKRLSREHLIIEVKKVPGKGFVHYASLYKQKSNKTFIGNNLLEHGDCVVLNSGDIIKLPDANLKFEIYDSEDTDTELDTENSGY